MRIAVHPIRVIAVVVAILAIVQPCRAQWAGVSVDDSVAATFRDWAFAYGRTPNEGLIRYLATYDEPFVTNPDHAAFLAIMYVQGVPGIFGKDTSRASQLMRYALAQEQIDAKVLYLGRAFDQRDAGAFQNRLTDLEGNALHPVHLERLRVFRLMGAIDSFGSQGSTMTKEEATVELMDWYRDSDSESSRRMAARALRIARTHHDVQLEWTDGALIRSFSEHKFVEGIFTETVSAWQHAKRTGSRRSAEMAVALAQRAASMNHEDSIRFLAYELWIGSDLVAQNREEAVYWLAKLVYLQDFKAAMMLAEAWLTGDGCEVNTEAAIALITRYGNGEYGGLWEGADAEAIRIELAKGPPHEREGEANPNSRQPAEAEAETAAE